jgi:hypothetical protein
MGAGELLHGVGSRVLAALAAVVVLWSIDAPSFLQSLQCGPGGILRSRRGGWGAPAAPDELPADCAGFPIPVVVLAHNNPSLVGPLVDQLRDCFDAAVIVADMGSDFPPMLTLLDALTLRPKVRVVRLTNLGPRGLFPGVGTSELMEELPRFFAMTDGDLRLGDATPLSFLCTLAHITQRVGVPKAALALDLSDADRMWRVGDYYMGKSIEEYEDAGWATAVAPEVLGGIGDLVQGQVFDFGSDTIFSVYDKAQAPCGYDDYSKHGAHCFTLRGVRVGGVMAAKHRPWYPDGEPWAWWGTRMGDGAGSGVGGTDRHHWAACWGLALFPSAAAGLAGSSRFPRTSPPSPRSAVVASWLPGELAAVFPAPGGTMATVLHKRGVIKRGGLNGVVDEQALRAISPPWRNRYRQVNISGYTCRPGARGEDAGLNDAEEEAWLQSREGTRLRPRVVNSLLDLSEERMEARSGGGARA